MATYYFDASVSGPTDPNAVWTTPALVVDNNGLTTTGTCVTTGTTSTNYLTAAGTNAPSNGSRIIQVRARSKTAPSNVTTNSTLEVYTAGLATLLGSGASGAKGTSGYNAYITLSAPTGGWTWSQIQTLVFKIYTTNNDVSVYIIEVDVTISHDEPSNYGPYVTVGDGMSRSEVAN